MYFILSLKSIVMENKNTWKGLLFSSCLAFTAVVGFTSCDKDDDDMNNAEQYTISGNASGNQEVPAVSGSAAGTLSGTYDKSTNTLNYNIGWTGLTGAPSAAHFHGPAATGVNAGVLVPIAITVNGATGGATGSIVVVDSVENALLAGNVYYNVHTVANPNGEIRGQVVLSPK